MTSAKPSRNALRKALRIRAHGTKPVVIIGGRGLTEAVLEEIDRALNDHELAKIKINADDREARNTMIATVCERLGAEVIQKIGFVAVFYREIVETGDLGAV